MSDIEIAQKAKMKRVVDIAKDQYGIESEHLEPYGHYKAKLSLDYIESLKSKPNGKLIPQQQSVQHPQVKAKPQQRSALAML